MGAVELGAKQICNVYGLSETYGHCAVIDAHEPLEVRLQSVGRPLDFGGGYIFLLVGK